MVNNSVFLVNKVHMLVFFNGLLISVVNIVLGQCRDNIEPKKLPISEEEQIYPWDTCAAVHDVRLSLLQRYFKDVSVLFIKCYFCM